MNPTERERALEAYGVATLREFMLAEMDGDEGEEE